eukprot:scaffold143306_cov68-Cyclotella_meneghiniana.AAC.1
MKLHKTVKRTCAVEGCSNGIVQGGLCISHGAKRKKCRFPGCEKNSKLAGLCSRHGPPRPQCDVMGCKNVSAQGRKCKSHATTVKCYVPGCDNIICGRSLTCRRHSNVEEQEVDSGSPDGVQMALPASCLNNEIEAAMNSNLQLHREVLSQNAIALSNPRTGALPMNPIQQLNQNVVEQDVFAASFPTTPNSMSVNPNQQLLHQNTLATSFPNTDFMLMNTKQQLYQNALAANMCAMNNNMGQLNSNQLSTQFIPSSYINSVMSMNAAMGTINPYLNPMLMPPANMSGYDRRRRDLGAAASASKRKGDNADEEDTK